MCFQLCVDLSGMTNNEPSCPPAPSSSRGTWTISLSSVSTRHTLLPLSHLATIVTGLTARVSQCLHFSNPHFYSIMALGAKMAAERQDALREFVAVRGWAGAEEDGPFFLESAGWDLQTGENTSTLHHTLTLGCDLCRKHHTEEINWKTCSFYDKDTILR